MNRDKLIEAIRLSIARVLDFKVNEKELKLLADHIIANGVGDITAEKHRANVAEEALKIASEQISCPHRINLIPCGNSCGNCDYKLMDYFTQRAKARLKERK